MWDKFIGTQIRRANRNLLIVNLLLLVVMGWQVFANHRTISGYLMGGQKAEPAILASRTPAEHTVVDVDADTVIPSGYRMVKHRSSGDEVEAEYLVMKAGDRMLIVKADAGQRGPHFTGTLTPISADLSAALMRDIKSERVRQSIMPVMLDTTAYRGEALGLLILGVPLMLLALWNLWKWMQRTSDPGLHPIVKQVEHRGGMMACQQIDSEMAQSSGKIGRAILTRSWVLLPHFFGMNVINLDDVVWAYKKITRHRVNFIPVAKTYTAVLCGSTGKKIEMLDGEKKVNDLLASIVAKAPWVLAGFTSEAETLWNKNRDALVQAVNQRRSAVMKKMAQAAAAPPAPAPQPAPTLA